MTVPEAASCLGFSQEYVRLLIRSEKLSARLWMGKRSKGYRIDRASLAAFARKQGEEEIAQLIESGLLPRSA